MASATYTCTMKNSWNHATYTISNNASGTVTVSLSVWRDASGGYTTSYNNNDSNNFWITIGGTTTYFTINSISTSKITKSASKAVSVAANGTGSVAVSVGGGLTGTTWGITGNNSKTYSFTDGNKAKYTISYNANGGTGAPASQTKTYGTTLTLSTTKPTKASTTDTDGNTISYTFKNWSGSDGKTYLAGASYTTNANLTLTAVWTTTTTINSFDVIYNANGGTNAPSNQEKKNGTTLVLTSDIPTRYGYTFTKWNTSVDGSGTSYNAGGSYTTNADIMLYAQWTPWTHTVMFNLNGGSGTLPSNFTKTTGADAIIGDSNLTKDRCSFDFWCTKPNGYGGNKYKTGEFYDHIQNGGSVTLYARWKEHKVVFGNAKSGNAGVIIASGFSESMDMTPDMVFSNIGEVLVKGDIVEDGTNPPVYKNGVLYCNGLIER